MNFKPKKAPSCADRLPRLPFSLKPLRLFDYSFYAFLYHFNNMGVKRFALLCFAMAGTLIFFSLVYLIIKNKTK